MLNESGEPVIAIADNKEMIINAAMINRHGLITGATGTGKTISLQTMAESFSQLGIPVFMADVKGDLSGIGAPAILDGKIGERVKELKLTEKGYKPQAFPVCFWDALGKNGHPMRATISDLGPLLLARILNLNDTQSGVLQLIFKIADDNGLLLLDLKDLRALVLHVGEEREKYRAQYGQISPASIGAIQRALLRLEEEGGDKFFGEPALDIMDLLQTVDGKGVINILDATTLINSPQLYSCVLLWLLSELFEQLPEAGDQKKPRLAFFFDEAHLLFDDISPVLAQKIEQVARLIRSRGVGIYFVSQSPADIPDNILGQLGNRLEHALRAFTPRDQKAVKAAAAAFRPNPAFDTAQAIGNLAIGEALVSFLDQKGAPAMVERAWVVAPQSKAGPLDMRQRQKLMANSIVAGVYDKAVDRESAYEILTERARKRQADEEEAKRRKEEDKLRRAAQSESRRSESKMRREAAGGKSPEMDILGSLVRQTTRSVGSTVGRELGKAVLRGLLGGLLGKKR